MKRLLGCWLLVVSCWLPVGGQQLSRVQQARNGAATVAWLQTRLWVREATGKNDGPAVAALVKAGGGNPAIRPEWCGFTQAADQRAHKLPIPANGMQGAARAWFWVPARRVPLDSVKPGHLAGFDYGRGIHHVARVAVVGKPLRAGRPPRTIWTIAGNEGQGANAGMHLTPYPSPNIAAFANWLW
jgi:hypothetical protein